MSDSSRLRVVLCWHMHQPNYFDPLENEYQLPWTYLHAIKDYVDMVAHLEAVPAARVVVNFAPILLEQIEDYSGQVAAYLKSGDGLRDHLLAALVTPALSTDIAHRLSLVKASLRINEETVINRFPHFQTLAGMARRLIHNADEFYYVDDQFIVDLVVWYHLGWVGETIRRSDSRIQALIEKERGFTFQDRRLLMQVIGEQLATVLGRYRCLAQKGQIELSFTPYAHPILPLLLDINSAHEAMPDAPLSSVTAYPGGKARAQWHIRKGLEVFERCFGFRPKGCWPSEGSVSDQTLALLAREGVEWAASGESVLRNSLARPETPPPLREQACVHRPYRVAGGGVSCFFRDDGLSDAIGFNYAKWRAEDAVQDLIGHLENIKVACQGNDDTVVSIILDGENAWEYYPENGYDFLRTLYDQLASHPAMEMTTFSDCVARIEEPPMLPHVVAGSWVYGTFSTWIGERDKNRGWDMLIEAKLAYDRVLAERRFAQKELEALERQLAVCEGSDWFWWFGDYNSAEVVSDFERLYRIQLTRLYHMMGQEPPQYLSEVFTHGGGTPSAAGTMRHGQEASEHRS